MTVDKTWTRWHADGWVLTVVRNASGEYFYRTQRENEPGTPLQSAGGLADAQHKAEDIVRNSGHRCVARCSYWIPDRPDDE